MRVITAKLRSISPYSQSKHYDTPKLEREGNADYEARTWRERLHCDRNGEVFIPPMAFKNCLSECAKYMSIQIPGKGKSTYTKHIEAGVMVLEPLKLGVKKEDVDGEWLFVPSDGVRGSGKRVNKCFPIIHEWEGEVTYHIFDEIITKDVFVKHLDAGGKFIGLGRWRPRNNGIYGRFEVVEVTEQTV